MSSAIQNDPGLIKREFIRVIKDFSQYLYNQKQAGNSFLGMSKESEDLMLNFGVTDPEMNFFFEGPETASVFILDSDTGFYKGESGRLLIKILEAMRLSPESVFICNAGNKKAVHRKINTILPEIIITLGTKAGQSLLKKAEPLEEFQGKFHDYHGIKVMPTFHPSLLVKQPEYKRKVWEDMKLVMEFSG